jgi:hypothetical protein
MAGSTIKAKCSKCQKKIKGAVDLLNQIIEKNIYDDKKENPQKNGISWNVHHLSLLLSLLQNETK